MKILLIPLLLLMGTMHVNAMTASYNRIDELRLAQACRPVPEEMVFHFQKSDTLVTTYIYACLRLHRHTQLDQFLIDFRQISEIPLVHMAFAVRIKGYTKEQFLDAFKGPGNTFVWNFLHMRASGDGIGAFQLLLQEPTTLEKKLLYWIDLSPKHSGLEDFVRGRFVNASFEYCGEAKSMLRRFLKGMKPLRRDTLILFTMVYVCDRESLGDIDFTSMQKKSGPFLYKTLEIKALFQQDMGMNYKTLPGSWSMFSQKNFRIFSSFVTQPKRF